MGFRYRVFGPPGTGKTTWLQRQVEKAIGSGIAGEEILVCSFSRAAFAEFASRLGDESVPRENLGTVHSLAYRAIGSPPLAVSGEAVKEWNKEARLGWRITPRVKGAGHTLNPMEDAADLTEDGDQLYDEVVLLRNRLVPIQEWPDEHREFWIVWSTWMEEQGLVDFPAMLERALHARVVPGENGSFRLFLVDEAQDLSPLQYQLVTYWAEFAQNVALIGDDDQAIYGWMGANGKAFLDFPGEDLVLSQSYRIPRAVHRVAERVASQISQRHPKAYRPRQEEGRAYRLHASLEETWLWLEEAMAVTEAGKKALILAPHRYMLDPVRKALLEAGAAYANPFAPHRREFNLLYEDGGANIPGWKRVAAYLQTPWRGKDVALWAHLLPVRLFRYRGAREELASFPQDVVVRPEDLRRYVLDGAADRLLARDVAFLEEHLLSTAPQGMRNALQVARRIPNLAEARRKAVWIGTIHSVKGGEADTVFLAPGFTSRAWHMTPPDDLHRLIYVGVTRAREELIVLDPGKAYEYPMPGVDA
jgi:DNA helicase-2/ATP-dependent DNA helicase PcrA